MIARAAKGHRGRPRSPEAGRIVVGIRVTAEERAALQAAADRDRRPLAQWARIALLDAAGRPTSR